MEFVEGAFSGREVERETDVDVALVYLRKQADSLTIDVGALFADLKREDVSEAELADGYHEEQPLAIKGTTVRNAVRAFEAAVQASREAVFADARASRYAGILGQTMTRAGDDERSTVFSEEDHAPTRVREAISKRYDELKERAWHGILSLTEVQSRVTEGVAKEINRRFEEVKELEFSEENIYGFLTGLVEHQGQLQLQMLIEIFDDICRYHSKNVCHYKGWKSNDVHHQGARRIHKRRFILPNYPDDYPGVGNPPWELLRKLSDFDTAFAFLDGKTPDWVKYSGLVARMQQRYAELCAGERIQSQYFELRYYPKAGTVHFFPRSQTLIDRLNLMVGRARNWLPPEGERVPEAFWLQYEQAESFAKDVQDGIRRRHRWYQQASDAQIDAALDEVLTERGYDLQAMVSHTSDDDGRALLAAA